MNIRVVLGFAANFFQDDFSLRIVRRAAAGEHQLAIHVSPDDLIGAHDADWVLQSVESRNLRNDGACRVYTEPLHDFLDARGIEIDILFGKRVDARKGKILRNGKLARELRRGKQRAIVAVNKRPEKTPDFRIGI